MKFNYLLTFLLLISSLYTSKACTLFNLSDGTNILVGKSNAWGLKDGYLILNPGNTTKKAFILGIDKPIKWTSKFGSITFNQISQEMPNGGINEKGLVVEILSSWAKYADKDQRKAINESQWIQYQLDNYETVEEVIKSEQHLRIRRAASDMHYFICDRFGNKATIDIINGKFRVHYNQNMPIPVLTNTPYEILRRQDTTHIDDSKLRFLIAGRAVAENKPVNTERAWKIIESCKQINNNYNVVYDLTNMILSYNDPVYGTIKTISIRELRFDCGQTKALPIQFNKTGNVTGFFAPYTKEMNSKQLDIVFTQLVNEGRIKGITKLLTRIFYIDKLKRIIKRQRCNEK